MALQGPHFRTNWKSSGVFWTGQTQGVWDRLKRSTGSLVNQSGKGSLITRLRESWLWAGKVSELYSDLQLNKFRHCRRRIDPGNGGKGASILSGLKRWIGLSGCFTPAQVVWRDFFALLPWLKEFPLQPWVVYRLPTTTTTTATSFCRDFAKSADQLKGVALYYLRCHQKPRENLSVMKMVTKLSGTLWVKWGKRESFGGATNLPKRFPERFWDMVNFLLSESKDLQDKIGRCFLRRTKDLIADQMPKKGKTSFHKSLNVFFFLSFTCCIKPDVRWSCLTFKTGLFWLTGSFFSIITPLVKVRL